MKLPGIEYNVPAPSLGRMDSSLPMSLERTQTQTMQRGVQLAVNVYKDIKESMDINEVAGAAADYESSMSKLNADIKNKKTYSAKYLEEMGIEYRKDYKEVDPITGQIVDINRDLIPAHEVMDKVYNTISNNAYSSAISKVSSRKGKSVISKLRGKLYSDGLETASKARYNFVNQYNTMQANANFEKAIVSGNKNAAVIVAATAKASGVWSPDYYTSKMASMPGRVDQSNFVREINMAGGPEDLEGIVTRILSTDNSLKPAQKMSLYKEAETKRNRQLKKIEADLKIQRTESSAKKFTTNAFAIVTDGAVSENIFNAMSVGMTPTDRKALFTLNRSVRNSSSNVSDPDALKTATTLVYSLSTPSVTPVEMRRESATQYLTQQLSQNKLSTTDFMNLFDRINKVQGSVYQNPEIKRQVDYIFTSLVGASKDMLTGIEPGIDVLNANKAEFDMLNAARQAGPSFNPQSWWQKNKNGYLTETFFDNMRSLKESKMGAYVSGDVRKGIDMTKTIANIKQALKNKWITENDKNEIMKKARRMQDLYEQTQMSIE